MNQFVIGVGSALTLFIIGWVAATELRIRTLQNKLLRSQEAVTDAGIEKKIHDLSDAELDALLSTRLGPGAPKPKS